MPGCALTASNNARSISRPVVSCAWRMRRLECPPSRPRSQFHQPAAVGELLFIELDAEREQFLDPGRSLRDDGAHGFLVAQARSGFEGVLHVQLEGIIRARHAGHAALRPGGVGVRGGALRNDGHPAVLGGFQGEG